MTLLLLHTLRQGLDLNSTATWRSWAGLSSNVTLTVMCINEEGEKHKVETGYCVGEPTDELEEFVSRSFLEEHVSSGSNNCAYSVLTSGSGKRLY
jgi:hypothetical protein